MSTKATYEFTEEQTKRRPPIIYKHHDGYPEGAACWIYNAFKHRHRGAAAGFLRGNPESELTESHEIHGDTEYRYTIDTTDPAWIVTALAGRYNDDDDDKTWTPYFVGTLAAMLEKYGHELLSPEEYWPLLSVERYGKSILMTAAEIMDRIDVLCKTLGHWAVESELPMTHGNAAGAREEIRALRAALTEEAKAGVIRARLAKAARWGGCAR